MTLEHLINAKPDEKIVISVRRHPIVLLGSMLVVAVIAAAPIMVAFLLNTAWPTALSQPMLRTAAILTLSAYELITWLFFITSFVDYYLDIWIVTTHRVISVEQNDLFSRKVSELDLTKAQDVTSEVKGFLPSILSYGDVTVQAAVNVEHFVFEQVPHPHDVRRKILELMEAESSRQMSPIMDAIKGDA
ncbi:MAG: hypothetical protein RLZZ324_407 [Candidatus Parcubacteria bacterium]|jgi:hypothetical protein